MADETKVEAQAAAEAPAKVAEAVADTVETIAKESDEGRQAHPRCDRSPREARGGRREGRPTRRAASHDPQDPHRRAQDRPKRRAPRKGLRP